MPFELVRVWLRGGQLREHDLNLRLRRVRLTPRSRRLRREPSALRADPLDLLVQRAVLHHAFLSLDHGLLQRTLGGDEPLSKRIRLFGVAFAEVLHGLAELRDAALG